MPLFPPLYSLPLPSPSLSISLCFFLYFLLYLPPAPSSRRLRDPPPRPPIQIRQDNRPATPLADEARLPGAVLTGHASPRPRPVQHRLGGREERHAFLLEARFLFRELERQDPETGNEEDVSDGHAQCEYIAKSLVLWQPMALYLLAFYLLLVGIPGLLSVVW